MAVDLGDYVESLEREVTPLGQDPIAVGEEVMVGYLTDAFWEARLDGFMSDYTADEEGIVTPDLPREKIALVVVYAGIRILRLQLVNTEHHFRATAGPVNFETRISATVMAEMLRQLENRKEKLLEALEQTNTVVIDALTVRTLSPGSYGGWVDQAIV